MLKVRIINVEKFDINFDFIIPLKQLKDLQLYMDLE